MWCSSFVRAYSYLLFSNLTELLRDLSSLVCYFPSLLLAIPCSVPDSSTCWMPCVRHKCVVCCCAVLLPWHLEQQGSSVCCYSPVAWIFEDNLVWWFNRDEEEDEEMCPCPVTLWALCTGQLQLVWKMKYISRRWRNLEGQVPVSGRTATIWR